MPSTYTFFENLADVMQDIPPESIVSRTLYKDERVKIVLFGFAAGQALSEHTASQPAILHFIQGEASLTLDADTHEVGAGAWVQMPAHLKHSVTAKTPLIMLLLLEKE